MTVFKKSSIIGVTIFALFLTTNTCTAQLYSAFLPQKENVIRDYCHSTQRVISSAIEMYNMDHSHYLTALEDKLVRNPGLLIPEYLSSPIKNTYECKYSSQGDLSKDGSILCSSHGIESKIDRLVQTRDDFKVVAQKLIESGCKVDGMDQDNETALHEAVRLEEFLIVEYLLSLKADPSLKNNQGKNALDLAVEKQNFKIAQLLKKSGAMLSNSPGDDSNQMIFHPKFWKAEGTVQIKTGDGWEPLNLNATYSLPISLRTGDQSKISFSLGKVNYAFLGLDLGKLEGVLSNQISVQLIGESEMVMEQPIFSPDLPIITQLPIKLKNGEMRLSGAGLNAQVKGPTVKMGEKVLVQCGFGKFKLTYDSANDSGAMVVRYGSLRAKPANSSAEPLEVLGYYKARFENGELSHCYQADMKKEFQ